MADREKITIWKRIEKRAEELRNASEYLKKISDSEKERIFKERAEKLSLLAKKSVDDKDLLNIISFTIADELYGIEVKYLEEVYEVNSVTRIPCTPTVVSSVINFRGTVLTVINLKALFNLQKENREEQERVVNKTGFSRKILILDYSGKKAGIGVDRLGGLLKLPRERIQTLSAIFLDRSKMIKSEIYIKDTPLLIIDSGALMNDEGLIVNEEV